MRNIERDQIKQDAAAQGVMEDGADEAEDMVPEIMPRHFEEAVRNARRSVSDRDLAQYSSFSVNLQQSRSQLTSGGNSLGAFSFPQNQNRSGPHSGAAMQQDEEEEDLYS